jgi:hypothetical protein
MDPSDPGCSFANVCSLNTELKALPGERLEHEITHLAAHIYAATCRWLDLVAEFDRREAFAASGCKSCAQWLSWRCSIAPGAAREHVRVARRLSELGLVRAAFARGELSYSKVRALTRMEGIEHEAELVELARQATAAQLERLVRAHRSARAVEEGASRADAERCLTWSWDDDGALVLRARQPAEQGALVVAALEAGREELRGAVDAKRVSTEAAASSDDGRAGEQAEHDASAETAQPSSAAATNADALVLMADTLLAKGAAERSDGDRYQVVVHVEADALCEVRASDPEEATGCELEGGPPLPVEAARRLTCEGSVVSLLERDGRALSVGRKTRAVPPAIRRALRGRDRCCRFPGCNQRRHLHAHHIEHWARGGQTSLINLLHVCRYHHRQLHEGGFTVARGGKGGLVFRRPDGRRFRYCPRPALGDPTAVTSAPHSAHVDPSACAPLGGGERFDFGLGVDALLTVAPPQAPPVQPPP